jgi:hypothetical protein
MKMTTPTIDCTPSNDPNVEIRSDLWTTMNAHELSNQQNIMLTRMSKMSTMISASSPPSMIMMYNSMQGALNHLNHLLERRQK